ncbi:unnamed protein product [Bursaphelenchus okinawaensis]|uniref:Secreted protein n=1 Tax=Bursaphelenchus okinawaensis TaxID=465554 RepID=A0A811KDX0_9BILA|nr:unnamed protein product [Bursaphelenchus okinawaensis]CAG9101349.1 unnamed protein product [Bursaphelenchus okinawaensis]
MVATNFPALLPQIVALTLLSLPSDQELSVTYTIFKHSSTDLKAVRYTQCQSTKITSGTPAGFCFVSNQYLVRQRMVFVEEAKGCCKLEGTDPKPV